MLKFLAPSLGVALIAMSVPVGSPAHAQQVVTNADRLEASDPLRPKAEGLVTLILQGKMAEAESFLRANSAPPAPATSKDGPAPSIAEQISSLGPTFGKGGFVADRFMKVGAQDVIVMASSPSGRRAAILVRFEPAPTHRIIEVSQVKIGNGSQR